MLSGSLSAVYLAQTKWQKVCVDLCVFKHTAPTENILEKERGKKEADTDKRYWTL